jgi:hypothetical protein
VIVCAYEGLPAHSLCGSGSRRGGSSLYIPSGMACTVSLRRSTFSASVQVDPEFIRHMDWKRRQMHVKGLLVLRNLYNCYLTVSPEILHCKTESS